MTNLVISDTCNRKCPYCFAEEYFDSKIGKKPHFITLDAFEARLDFLERSGMSEVRLIGGEPSLHPQFPELIRRARARDKRILVFTNGFMPEKALASLETLSPEECTVLVNMNTSAKSGSRVNRQWVLERALRRLGLRVLLGFSIYRLDFDLDPLLKIILNFGCRKAIRLGLAQPTLSGQNQFLNARQYSMAGQRIARFADMAAKEDIHLEFDCGFVRCMFTDDQLITLRRTGTDIGWRCNPILDIDLNQSVFHCFPLAGRIQTLLSDTCDATGLRDKLSTQVESYRLAGICKTCSSCQFKRTEECTGGCLAYTMRRFQSAQFTLEIPVPEDWIESRGPIDQ